MLAVLANDVEMVRTLITLGAPVDQIDQQGETALMHASMIGFGDTAVVEALLAAGADRHIRWREKTTALDMAVALHHDAIASVLER